MLVKRPQLHCVHNNAQQVRCGAPSLVSAQALVFQKVPFSLCLQAEHNDFQLCASSLVGGMAHFFQIRLGSCAVFAYQTLLSG